ncbi:hypothetical protein DFH27DRAFT_142772 [Peziza echinospora]|nr:hypothetical protein DFH27DRAFT_142772 [Peziza echinospora]
MAKPPQHSYISTLPPEILDTILAYLHPQKFELYGGNPDDADSLVPDSLRDLVSLSSTCRPLRICTSGYIYSSLNLIWTNSTDPPVVLLLRTLLCRPDLAAMVTRVVLVRWCMKLIYNATTGVDTCFNDVERGILRARMNELGIQEGGAGGGDGGDGWHAAIALGDCDALTAILLSLLPNLQCMTLDLDHTHERSNPIYLYKLLDLRLQPAQRPLWGNLKSIDMCTLTSHVRQFCRWSDPQYEMDSNIYVLPLLTSPHIQLSSISLTLSNFTPPILPTQGLGMYCNSLKSLALTTGHQEILAGLLHVCPRVETLRYLLYRNIDCDGELQYSNLAWLRKTLEIRSDTLIEVSVVHQWYDDGIDDLEILGSPLPNGMLTPGHYYMLRIAPDESNMAEEEDYYGVGYVGEGLLPFGKEMEKLERLSGSLTVLLGHTRMDELVSALRGSGFNDLQHDGDDEHYVPKLSFAFSRSLPQQLKKLWIHRLDDGFIWKRLTFNRCVSFLLKQLVQEKQASTCSAGNLEFASYPHPGWFPRYSRFLPDFFEEQEMLGKMDLEPPVKLLKEMGEVAGVRIVTNETHMVMDWEPRIDWHYRDTDEEL